MPRVEKNGNRKKREQTTKHRRPKMGYYFIVTDADEVVQNYMHGFKKSLPKELQEKLIITSVKTTAENLVDEALNLASLYPQFGEIWIVFNGAQIEKFVKIICKAREKGVGVGWSNPSIEAWFNAYLGEMPNYQESGACYKDFTTNYQRITGQEYNKSDIQIYEKLNRFGNEQDAIALAERKFVEYRADCEDRPSKMCSCTTIHLLVKKIKSNIVKE